MDTKRERCRWRKDAGKGSVLTGEKDRLQRREHESEAGGELRKA